jgi:hypothetical protein
VAVVGNLVSYLRAKLESKSVTPDTAFRFNSKDAYVILNNATPTEDIRKSYAMTRIEPDVAAEEKKKASR